MNHDGDNPVERIEHRGRVYRWERQGSAWPGHTCFVALRGSEVVVGDRYARDGIERSYGCSFQQLLDGFFAELIEQQLGADVLEELRAEVRRALGSKARAEAPAKPAEVPAKPARAEAPEVAPPEPSAAVTDPSAKVDVTLAAGSVVDVALAVELRAITRAAVADVLSRLGQPPVVVVSDIARAEAETIARRLETLGATVELRPASA